MPEKDSLLLPRFISGNKYWPPKVLLYGWYGWRKKIKLTAALSVTGRKWTVIYSVAKTHTQFGLHNRSTQRGKLKMIDYRFHKQLLVKSKG